MRVLAAAIGLLALAGPAMAEDPYSFYQPWAGTTLYQGAPSAPSYQPTYSAPLISNSFGGSTTYSDGTISNSFGGSTTFSDGTICNSTGGSTTCSGSSLGGPVEIYLNAIGR